MTSLLRATVVCLATLSLVVAAGCGGSDTKKSNDYVSAINRVQTDFAANVQKVGSGPAGNDPAAAAKRTFSKLETAIGKAVSDLEGVTPPDKVKALHGQLVREMTDFKVEVKSAGDSLASKDPKKILSAQSRFATAASSVGSRIAATIDAINTKLHG